MKKLLLLIGIGLVSAVQAQTTKPDLFPDLVRYKNTGWVVEPGITYQLSNPSESFAVDSMSAGKYDINVEGKGRLGGSFVFGIHHWIPRGLVINDIDYGVGVKYFAGQELQEIKHTINEVESAVSNNYTWSELQGTFTVNFNRIFQLNHLNFVKIGVGADFNLVMLPKINDNAFKGSPHIGKNIFQQHVSLGYGFAIGDHWYLTPKLEIPLVDLNELAISHTARKHYLIGQRPILFTLQFKSRWMRKQDRCGPGEKPVDLYNMKRKKKDKNKIKKGQLR